MTKNTPVYEFKEPLHEIKEASYDLRVGTGNLAIGQLEDATDMLASGAIEYLVKQVPPVKTVDVAEGHATLTLKAGGGLKSGFRFPWEVYAGITNWQILLNPEIPSEINAKSGGGHVNFDLRRMNVARASVDSGGGNLNMILPERAADLQVQAISGGGNVSVDLGDGTHGVNSVIAKSGAGRVNVIIPDGIAALIHISTGMGKATVDPRFSQIDKKTYRSIDYERAGDRVEITAESGAGDVAVSVR